MSRTVTPSLSTTASSFAARSTNTSAKKRWCALAMMSCATASGSLAWWATFSCQLPAKSLKISPTFMVAMRQVSQENATAIAARRRKEKPYRPRRALPSPADGRMRRYASARAKSLPWVGSAGMSATRGKGSSPLGAITTACAPAGLAP